jgi:O-antigen/teichoic acid export membrane protein
VQDAALTDPVQSLDPSPGGVGYRIVTGVGSSVVRQALGAVESLLVVPLFLSAWGADRYGRWVALVAIVSYIGALDFGAQSYVGNLLAMEYARGEIGRFRQVLSQVASFFLVVVVIGALGVLGILLGVIPIGFTLDRAAGEGWIFAFLAGTALIAVPGGVYATVYQASGRYAHGLMLGNAARLIGLAVGMIVLFAALPPVVYAAVTLAIAATFTLVLVSDSRRRFSHARGLTISTTNARRALAHLPGAFHFWLLSLAQTIKVQGPVLVIAATGQMSLISLYVTHRALANVATYTTAFVQGPLTPELSWLAALRRSTDLEHACLALVKVSILATGFTALFIYIVAPTFYPLWTRQRFDLAPLLLELLLLQAVLTAGWATTTWATLAANQHRAVAYWSVANALLTVVAVWLVIPVAGIAGVAAAALASDILCGMLVFPRLGARVSGTKPVIVYEAMLHAILPVIALFFFAKITTSLFNSWPAATVFVVGGALLAYPIACFLLGCEMARWILGSVKGALAGRLR